MKWTFVLPVLLASSAAAALPPDLVVSADGSGDFKTVQAAIASISETNRERTVILIRDGVYHEKIRVNAPFITLRGQSRKGTRIEFPQLNDAFVRAPDALGPGVINLAEHADDFVLETLTVENTAGEIGPHAFAIRGAADRTVLLDCDVLSDGADTVSLWLADRGKYYHAGCNFRGSVDFVCPRGWCYATNCTFYEMKDTAAIWHDGARDPDMKFVLRGCRFDGTNGWNLARHHHDAQFFLLDCAFSKTMIDRPPFRVTYPLDGSTPGEADTKRNKDLDKSNVWGERRYFYQCHRDGGDYAWLTNNLSSATNAPLPNQVNAAWTFAGKWDPEKKTGPAIREVKSASGQISLVFDENVTVKGKPRLALHGGGFAEYVSGSGTNVLLFSNPAATHSEVAAVDLKGGALVATEAGAMIRQANLSLPAASR
jgi:pectinesterase